jgi:hypothetical protein
LLTENLPGLTESVLLTVDTELIVTVLVVVDVGIARQLQAEDSVEPAA